MTVIYYIKKGCLSFADKIIFSDIEIYLSAGDKICLIGRNGCGKSSLLKVICGNYELDNGEIFQDSKTTIAYLTQDIKTNLGSTIYDFVLNEIEDAEQERYQADIILEKLSLNGDLILSNCSGGQLRRAYLARSLILKPDILLLDEPTNHLDITTIEWLEDFVRSYQGAVICISHDRAFLTNVTNKIWWLDQGVIRKSEKGFKYFDEWQEQIIQQEEAKLQKLNKKLENENDWLNVGVTARRKRNQKRLADLIALRADAKKQKDKTIFAKQKIKSINSEEVAKTRFIIEAKSISFSYDNKKIISDFNFRVKKGEKIAIIGANGSGKSTFIKLLMKQLQPDSGQIIHGTNLEITYIDQHRAELDQTCSLQQILCPTGGDQVLLANGNTIHVAGYLKRFMFSPALLTAKVTTLSGGEASRLLLAKMLANPSNLLILDEPTNDLDLDSLEMLVEVLAEYEGTLIIVSHDRDFLDRVTSRSLVFASGKITDLVGNYGDYQQLVSKESLQKQAKASLLKSTTPIKNQYPKRLSYKHQRLLETIPLEVEAIESKIKTIEAQLYDDSLYSTNAAKFYELTTELEQLRLTLDSLMNEWLNIEEMNNSCVAANINKNHL